MMSTLTISGHSNWILAQDFDAVLAMVVIPASETIFEHIPRKCYFVRVFVSPPNHIESGLWIFGRSSHG
jgi:hypothetical protein